MFRFEKSRIKENGGKTQTISLCKVNWKSTWRLIGTLVNHKIKGQIHPTKIVKLLNLNLILLNNLTTIFEILALNVPVPSKSLMIIP